MCKAHSECIARGMGHTSLGIFKIRCSEIESGSNFITMKHSKLAPAVR